MDFNMFCKKTAKYLGLELCTMKENAKRAVTMCATKSLPKPPYQVEFTDMTLSEDHPCFCAEVYGNLGGKNILLGYIGWEKVVENFGNFEHWECQVSPEGLYNEDFMPVNKNGEEIDGELWQYYYGGSLKRACKSFLKGGALLNPTRKPKRVW